MYGKTHIVGAVKSGGLILASFGGKQDLTLDPPLLDATDVWQNTYSWSDPRFSPDRADF